MDPRIFELFYFRDEKDNPGLDDILKTIQEIGYTTRQVSCDDLEREYQGLPEGAKFCNKELDLAGAPNLFVPRPKYRDRILKSLSRGGN